MLKKDYYKYLVLDLLQALVSFISSNFGLLLSYYTRNTAIEILFVVLTVGLAYSTVYSFIDIAKCTKQYRLSNYV